MGKINTEAQSIHNVQVLNRRQSAAEAQERELAIIKLHLFSKSHFPPPIHSPAICLYYNYLGLHYVCVS